MMRSHKKKKIALSIFVAAVLVLVSWLAWPNGASAPGGRPQSNSANKSPASFDKSQYSINDPSSLWVVVNKGRILPSDYVPAGLVAPNIPLRLSSGASEMKLRPDTAAALEKMAAAASKDGINLMLSSGYRSYYTQQSLYSAYAARDGIAKADTYSARAGHSEHQTGLAADLEPTSRKCEVDQCFESTPEGQWLAANAQNFGFIIRYQKTTQNLTGYEYEPWHVRYVGDALAAQLYQSGQTMEQFFNLPDYLQYPQQSYQLKNGN